MKLAEVTMTKAMPVKGMLPTVMSDSETRQEQVNRRSGMRQGKSKVSAVVCNREEHNESKTDTMTETRR